jgi:hypothetical protein
MLILILILNSIHLIFECPSLVCRLSVEELKNEQPVNQRSKTSRALFPLWDDTFPQQMANEFEAVVDKSVAALLAKAAVNDWEQVFQLHVEEWGDISDIPPLVRRKLLSHAMRRLNKQWFDWLGLPDEYKDVFLDNVEGVAEILELKEGNWKKLGMPTHLRNRLIKKACLWEGVQTQGMFLSSWKWPCLVHARHKS